MIDALLGRRLDVIVVPSGNALVGIADRAGYPVLTVPAGYGTGGAGRNPIGVTFVGAAFGEAELLAAGYAFEQATNVRLAPSCTNPSMFRCVPGSTFFSPHHCHPGDLLGADRVRARPRRPSRATSAARSRRRCRSTLGAPADVRRVHAGRRRRRTRRRRRRP